jgi:DNA-directed RNA polymerase sigma subunit (sigma70/sigma32)
MGVCKERIRQIQSRAMERLRELAAEAKLEQTVDNWL